MQFYIRIRGRVDPTGSERGLGAVQRQQRGDERMQDMAADAGTQQGAHRCAVEAGGQRVWEKSMCKTYHSRRGGGERVLQRQR